MLFQLKETLKLCSSFQIVGNKVFLESSPLGVALMLEVIGLPQNPDQNTLVIADQEACEQWLYRFQGVDLFHFDLDALLAEAHSISSALDKFGDKLSAYFQIVFDNEKIELHFFRQKDYIQTLL